MIRRFERNQLHSRRRVLAFFFVFTLVTFNISALAANQSDDPLLRALQDEMDRSKAKLKMDDVAAPYFIEYRVTEIEAFDASATFGALRNQQHSGGRFLRVVVRIGDYKQDSYYGGGEGTLDMIPLDEDVYAIRHRVWLATDRAYKAAGEALSAKKAALKQMTIDQPVDDFARATPVQSIEPLAHLPKTDFTPWLRLLEDSSGLYRSDPKLQRFESALRFQTTNHYLVNSEGTVTRSGSTVYTVTIAGSTQASDGLSLQRSHEDEAKDLSGLPSREKFLETTAYILETLKQLRDALVAEEEYRGPVLLSNDAAASVVLELIAPNLLGRKPKLGENARTTGAWASSYKMRVLPDFINVVDDPTISTFVNLPLFGDSKFDDEGVKAERVSLVENGQIVSYLIGREPIRDFPASNGHGRASATSGPEPRPANLILGTNDPRPDGELKKKLVELARQRDLPYGIFVETLGPGLEPRLVYRVYTADGREELIRGAVFGDLDVRSLRSNLIAAGTAPTVENHVESIPFSVASPALLFNELLIKRTPASKQGLPEYGPPPFSDSAKGDSKK
ncbi:MAG TPA: metallopeptidase TldD-related protein [Terriglobales bacterium]|nr:metallopeptidase TldD-related protein [Terriglobales bacterium]